MDPQTALHRPPTPKQIRSAQKHQKSFAAWEASFGIPKRIIDQRDDRPTAREILSKADYTKCKSPGDAIRVWYAQRQKLSQISSIEDSVAAERQRRK